VAVAGDVQEAERLGQVRAILFCMMALVAAATALAALRDAPSPGRLVLWVVTMALMAANLTGIGGWMKPVAVRRLMNDETTRAHRQASLATGFWAAVGGALLLALAAGPLALSPVAVAQLLATAALCAASLNFAVLELRASNG
jgi:hypothetical protein